MSEYLQVNSTATGTNKQVNVRILTPEEITNKQITLDFIPASPESVVVLPAGSVVQQFGIDYIIIDNLLLWGNLGLDGVLDASDTLFLFY